MTAVGLDVLHGCKAPIDVLVDSSRARAGRRAPTMQVGELSPPRKKAAETRPYSVGRFLSGFLTWWSERMPRFTVSVAGES